MDVTLAKIGVVCIIAAIVGGTLKAPGFELETPADVWRQIALAGFGLVLIFVDWLRGRSDDDNDTARTTSPMVVMIVGGVIAGVLLAALISASVGAAKTGLAGPAAALGAARTAVVDGHVIELGAVLGGVCGACWSYFQRLHPGMSMAMVLVAGATLGASGRFLNPIGVRVETPEGIVRAAAFGAVVALILVLALRRLRI